MGRREVTHRRASKQRSGLTGWVVKTDGFEYSQRGLVLDQLSLSASADLASDTPSTKLSKRAFVWLGEIALGMSKKKVLEVLKGRGVSITLTKDGCEISVRGFSALTSISAPLRNWKATLTFSDDLLTRLDLSAGTD
jgi:hypothetical protein